MTSISGIGSTPTPAPTPAPSPSNTGSATTGNPGSGLLSSAGIGSGLDVNAIITALVNAKQAGPQAQINNESTKLQSQAAGLTALSSALNSLQGAVSTLGNSSTFNTFTATLANAAVGTASTLANAQPGTYNVVVNSLATAQSRTSAAYASGTPVGAGTLTLTVGSQSVDITVGASDQVSDIATAINQASGNPGVQATVVYGTSGAQLLLTSTRTGVANGFTVTAGSGSSTGLSSLATTLNTAGSNEASDASLSINGIAATSASNAVSGVLDGVTLNLKATGTTTLTVSQDTSEVTDAVNGFVDAYNNYAATVATLSSYDPSSKQAGVLLGDATLQAVQRQVNSLLSSSVAGNSIGSLAALGIARNADGSMMVNSDTLNSALQNNSSAVQSLFSGTNGFATTLNAALNSFTAGNGIIATRNTSIQNQLTGLGQQTAALNARMAVYQAQLSQQYTALDTLMSSLSNTSSYLTNSLATILSPYIASNK